MGKLFDKTSYEARVRGVADGEPQDQRRRAKLFEQQHEVAVFGQHDGLRLPGGQEDATVFGLAQAEFPNRLRLNVELRR